MIDWQLSPEDSQPHRDEEEIAELDSVIVQPPGFPLLLHSSVEGDGESTISGIM